MTAFDVDDLEMGFELPAFERTGDLASWNRFAAVNDEFVAIHMDDEAGRTAGYPTAFGMGNLQVAYLHSALREWLGDHGKVTRLAAQFRSPAVRGSLNSAGGVVDAIEVIDEQTVVDLTVWVRDDAGEQMTTGTATVVLHGSPNG
jgi:hypothetical protein